MNEMTYQGEIRLLVESLYKIAIEPSVILLTERLTGYMSMAGPRALNSGAAHLPPKDNAASRQSTCLPEHRVMAGSLRRHEQFTQNRTRTGTTLTDHMVGKPTARISKPRADPLRRSTRLRKIREREQGNQAQHLPSPVSSQTQHAHNLGPRKRPRAEGDGEPETDRAKRLRGPTKLVEDDRIGRVEHWARYASWPNELRKEHDGIMTERSSSKRRSDSNHHSNRVARLEENGIFMQASALVRAESKALCEELLIGSYRPRLYPSFPPDKVDLVLGRVQTQNESRLQRDITPLVAPSAENLALCDVPGLDGIGDEVNANWNGCATMGSSQPKPDYAAGFRITAFTKAEMDTLDHYATLDRPVRFTPNLCFPFLMCEAKTGERGMNEADRQNIHSASIAVRAIIELYRAAYGAIEPERVSDLYGRILVFTVSHNNKLVSLCGHYARLADDSDERLLFYRYEIDLSSLTLRDGVERFRSYNFVRNVYERIGSERLKMLKAAIARLPPPPKRTGLSFISSDDADRSRASSQDSTVLQQALGELREQLRQQREEAKENEVRLERLIEQQRHEAGEKDARLERLIERHQQEVQEKEERLEQQRLRMEEQGREMISLLQSIASQTPRGSRRGRAGR
jgi:hypothetical protein